jgi:hypothetical protein
MNAYTTATNESVANYAAMFKKRNLLSEGSTNAKTAKNSLKSYILYLSPYNQNSKGINICPNASAGCIFGCLNTSGRGRFNSVQLARMQRTEFYLSQRSVFVNKILKELIRLNNKAAKLGEKFAIRLNGTSDLDFIAIIKNRTNVDVLTQLPNLIFYDYTKTLGKVKKYAGSNYVLTFSRSESNASECIEALQLGANVAAVFQKQLPSNYLGASVIDGDKSDIVMLYNRGVILGLTAKGKAKKDSSGFVVN